MTMQSSRSATRDGGRAHGELWARLGSALVLASIAIAATLAGDWAFAAMIGAGTMVLAWEWGRMVRAETASLTMIVHGATLIAAVLLTVVGAFAAAFGALAVGAVAVAALRREVWSPLGVFYFGLPAMALVFVRSDAALGAAAILYLFVVVWGADTAAYFCGRLIGGPRLAPRISPKKTWAGFIGGSLAPGLLGLAAAAWLGATSPTMLAASSIGLAIVSQLGDLAESAAKRAFGAKDASQLIPGHGGLLDRVDGFLFAGLAAAGLALARDAAHPGHAILIWS